MGYLSIPYFLVAGILLTGSGICLLAILSGCKQIISRKKLEREKKRKAKEEAGYGG